MGFKDTNSQPKPSHIVAKEVAKSKLSKSLKIHESGWHFPGCGFVQDDLQLIKGLFGFPDFRRIPGFSDFRIKPTPTDSQIFGFFILGKMSIGICGLGGFAMDGKWLLASN